MCMNEGLILLSEKVRMLPFFMTLPATETPVATEKKKLAITYTRKKDYGYETALKR